MKKKIIIFGATGNVGSYVFKYAKEWEIENPKVIGWDFPFLSPEQINIYHMHGYTAALCFARRNCI